MAWRLHEHVLRGEIDNRTRGRVFGRIWLADLEKPLVLELLGDCYPDLAGSLLRFEKSAAGRDDDEVAGVAPARHGR